MSKGLEVTPLVLARVHRPKGLRPGEMIIGHRNQHQLRTKIREMSNRGLLAGAYPMVVDKSSGAAYVLIVRTTKRLRGRRMWPWYTGSAVIGVGVLSGLCWALWSIVPVLARLALPTMAAAGLLWLLTRSNHSGACSGLHCSGCKG